MNKAQETTQGLTQGLGESIAQAINTGGGKLEIVYREDKATIIHEETPVSLIGILDNPARWLEARQSLHLPLQAYVMVDREALSISLVTEERSDFKNSIIGELKLHPAFIFFGINKEEYITTQKMADKIKMNRLFFETKSDAMQLVTLLKDFKARVNKEVEKKNTNNGDYKVLFAQEVLHNLPPSFKMKIPIFKGQNPILMEVELYIEPEELKCCLISPEANEEKEHLRDTAIDAVLDRMKDALPGIVILEK
jgi:hypothetical protein